MYTHIYIVICIHLFVCVYIFGYAFINSVTYLFGYLSVYFKCVDLFSYLFICFLNMYLCIDLTY